MASLPVESSSPSPSSPLPLSPSPKRARLIDINQQLTCVLCGGYFIDATCIVECLHSFCKSCILRYIDSCQSCPICDAQCLKAKTQTSLKSDTTLQEIVYKLVPGLFKSEMETRRLFYANQPEAAESASPEDKGETGDHKVFYTPKDKISLSLEYGFGENQVPNADGVHPGSGSKEKENIDKLNAMATNRRYLLCQAGMPVALLKKFMVKKYDLPGHYKVDIMYLEDVLSEDYTLMDVAYIYSWRRSDPMRLFYRITERVAPERLGMHLKRAHSESKALPTATEKRDNAVSGQPRQPSVQITSTTPATSSTEPSKPATNCSSSAVTGKSSQSRQISSTTSTMTETESSPSSSSATPSLAPKGAKTRVSVAVMTNGTAGKPIRKPRPTYVSGSVQTEEPPKKLRKVSPPNGSTPKAVPVHSAAPSMGRKASASAPGLSSRQGSASSSTSTSTSTSTTSSTSTSTSTLTSTSPLSGSTPSNGNLSKSASTVSTLRTMRIPSEGRKIPSLTISAPKCSEDVSLGGGGQASPSRSLPSPGYKSARASERSMDTSPKTHQSQGQTQSQPNAHRDSSKRHKSFNVRSLIGYQSPPRNHGHSTHAAATSSTSTSAATSTSSSRDKERGRNSGEGREGRDGKKVKSPKSPGKGSFGDWGEEICVNFHSSVTSKGITIVRDVNRNTVAPSSSSAATATTPSPTGTSAQSNHSDLSSHPSSKNTVASNVSASTRETERHVNRSTVTPSASSSPSVTTATTAITSSPTVTSAQPNHSDLSAPPSKNSTASNASESTREIVRNVTRNAAPSSSSSSTTTPSSAAPASTPSSTVTSAKSNHSDLSATSSLKNSLASNVNPATPCYSIRSSSSTTYAAAVSSTIISTVPVPAPERLLMPLKIPCPKPAGLLCKQSEYKSCKQSPANSGSLNRDTNGNSKSSPPINIRTSFNHMTQHQHHKQKQCQSLPSSKPLKSHPSSLSSISSSASSGSSSKEAKHQHPKAGFQPKAKAHQQKQPQQRPQPQPQPQTQSKHQHQAAALSQQRQPQRVAEEQQKRQQQQQQQQQPQKSQSPPTRVVVPEKETHKKPSQSQAEPVAASQPLPASGGSGGGGAPPAKALGESSKSWSELETPSLSLSLSLQKVQSKGASLDLIVNKIASGGTAKSVPVNATSSSSSPIAGAKERERERRAGGGPQGTSLTTSSTSISSTSSCTETRRGVISTASLSEKSSNEVGDKSGNNGNNGQLSPAAAASAVAPVPALPLSPASLSCHSSEMGTSKKDNMGALDLSCTSSRSKVTLWASSY